MIEAQVWRDSARSTHSLGIKRIFRLCPEVFSE